MILSKDFQGTIHITFIFDRYVNDGPKDGEVLGAGKGFKLT